MSSIFTNRQLDKMWKLYKEGKTLRQIAKCFGSVQHVISREMNNQNKNPRN